jgi:hypothetical protein
MAADSEAAVVRSQFAVSGKSGSQMTKWFSLKEKDGKSRRSSQSSNRGGDCTCSNANPKDDRKQRQNKISTRPSHTFHRDAGSMFWLVTL